MPRKSSIPLTTRQAIIRDYQAGMASRVVAQKHNVHHSTVIEANRRATAPIRRVGRPSAPEPRWKTLMRRWR